MDAALAAAAWMSSAEPLECPSEAAVCRFLAVSASLRLVCGRIWHLTSLSTRSRQSSSISQWRRCSLPNAPGSACSSCVSLLLHTGTSSLQSPLCVLPAHPPWVTICYVTRLLCLPSCAGGRPIYPYPAESSRAAKKRAMTSRGVHLAAMMPTRCLKHSSDVREA